MTSKTAKYYPSHKTLFTQLFFQYMPFIFQITKLIYFSDELKMFHS